METGNKIYKLVLTGGPCGGKTTGQARLSSFFESLGWKVYRVPECATVLMSGGVKWQEMNPHMAYMFQCNLIRSMMQLEKTYIDLAQGSSINCLIICDRGTMDASAYMSAEDWARLKQELDLKDVTLRDDRYNQVIHMVSAADGAEDFYTTEEHTVRYETPEVARKLDDLASQAWVGHPYYDVIDNSTDFESKVIRMLATVCYRLGLDLGDRLHINSKKRKFLVTSLPDKSVFPQHQDFEVIHDYLVTPSRKMQARIRRRGQNGSWTYTHTIRRPKINNQVVETKQPISGRNYQNLLAQKDSGHFTIVKMRRCFLWNNQYFQMDIYKDPCHPRCKDLVFLETYTTKVNDEMILPDFLTISQDVTGNPQYSMFNLSLKDGRQNKKSYLMTDCRANTFDLIEVPVDVVNCHDDKIHDAATNNHNQDENQKHLKASDKNHNSVQNGIDH